MKIFAQMGTTKKDSGLAAGTLEGTKNFHTHEKPMVSFQFGQVLMTFSLFLLLILARLSDNLLFAPTMPEIMLTLTVEILRTEAKNWHLTRKLRIVKFMLL